MTGSVGRRVNCSSWVKVRPEPVRIERFVAEQSPEGDALDQRPHADTVVVLAGQQDEPHQVTNGDDLGRQNATRAADGLVPGPPFAPLAFGWAVTMVPSTRAYSKSGSSDRHSKTRSKTRAKTPPFTQRRNRWKTLFQGP